MFLWAFRHLVKNLLSKFNYEIKKLLIDETGEEFNALNLFQHKPEFFGPIGPHISPPPPPPPLPPQQHPHFVNDNNNNDNGYHYPNPNDGYQYPNPNVGYQYPNPNDGYHYNVPNNQVYKNDNGYYNDEPIYIPKPTTTGYKKNGVRYYKRSYYQPVTRYNRAEVFRRYKIIYMYIHILRTFIILFNQF